MLRQQRFQRHSHWSVRLGGKGTKQSATRIRTGRSAGMTGLRQSTALTPKRSEGPDCSLEAHWRTEPGLLKTEAVSGWGDGRPALAGA
jgi:hypothetical protein